MVVVMFVYVRFGFDVIWVLCGCCVGVVVLWHKIWVLFGLGVVWLSCECGAVLLCLG